MSIDWKWYAIVLVILDWIIVLTGILGNITILVSLTIYKTIRNPITRFLFINLTITDLGVLAVRHTFHIIQLYMRGRWVFGELPCRIIPPVSRTFLTVSILTLVAISHHRYTCIVGSLRSHSSLRRAVVKVTLMWLVVFTLYTILDMPFRQLDSKTQRCKSILSPKLYIIFLISEKAFYVACFVCIFLMFSRMRKALRSSLRIQEDSNIERQFSPSVKTLKLLKPTVIVLLMTLCPAWLIHVLAIVNREATPAQRYLMYHIVGILMVVNSAANPFIYVIMSNSFRQSSAQMLRSFIRKIA